MWNDMSASTRQYADAVKAFGNPFNVT